MINLRPVRKILSFICFMVILTISFHTSADEIHKNKIINHIIEIELYPKEHMLRATDHVSVQCRGAETVSFSLHRSLQILSVHALNKELEFITRSMFKDIQQIEIFIPPDLREFNELIFDIVYEGSLTAAPSSLEKEDVGETTGIISERGVYLSPASLWYPDIPLTLSTFKVTTITPVGYETIIQGTLTSKKSIDDKVYTTWEEKNVAEGCHLVSGKYQVTNVTYNNIEIYAYFFPEEQGLAKTYLDATIRYLDMYQELLGDYPYEKFAIVENFFQTGYGMPSFTLLGSAVVKLPFIVETSLGHEILHNWWGNSVFVDESQGNWCEGLTTYMADYYYKELSNAADAEAYRKDICRKYTNYVTKRNDFPLAKFLGRTDRATQAIGYGKTAMVFHMLRQMIGDEKFYQALKRLYKEKIWQQASWKDIQYIFEDTCKIDLSWFFHQWVNQTGAPFIELGKTEVEKNQDGWLTKMEISQNDKPYRISLPIYLELDNGDFSTAVEVQEKFQTISIQTKSQPRYIAIDPHYDIFRRLSIEEIPPTIDLVLGDEDKIIVYPTGGEGSLQAAYKRFAQFLRDNETIIKADTEVTESEITQKSIFILGGPHENALTKIFLETLPGNFLLKEDIFAVNDITYSDKDNALLVTLKNPRNKEKGIALFSGFSPAAIEKLGAKIPHYGKYSYLIFANGKNIEKGIFPITNTPLQRYLKK
ncbi:MAG: M1 family peptidase [wastewater metagenome]|nr:M1 family peptidase [Candidatus Loosdrechtia aerotolerans]